MSLRFGTLAPYRYLCVLRVSPLRRQNASCRQLEERMNRRALQPRIRLLLQSNAPREQTLLLRKCFFHHFELFGRVHINKAAAHRLGLEHFGL